MQKEFLWHCLIYLLVGIALGSLPMTLRAEDKDGLESRRLYITADYAVGSSGGPVVNARGAVVGVIAATRSAKTGGGSGEIQMVVGLTVPIVELLDMID